MARLGNEARLRRQSATTFDRFGRILGIGLVSSLSLVLLSLGFRRMLGGRSGRVPLAVSRITASDACTRLDSGAAVTLIDARSDGDLARTHLGAVGSLRMNGTPQDLEAFRVRVAPDGEVIAYCT